MTYYFSKTLKLPFGDAIARAKEGLKKEGFGVLTEIDVKETMKQKLDVDFRNYTILGACNPRFAHQALQAEDTQNGDRELVSRTRSKRIILWLIPWKQRTDLRRNE